MKPLALPAALLAALLSLAACGVDGAPERPAPKPAPKTPGYSVTVGGDAQIGVVTEL